MKLLRCDNCLDDILAKDMDVTNLLFSSESAVPFCHPRISSEIDLCGPCAAVIEGFGGFRQLILYALKHPAGSEK